MHRTQWLAIGAILIGSLLLYTHWSKAQVEAGYSPGSPGPPSASAGSSTPAGHARTASGDIDGDSANSDDVVKSWTANSTPSDVDRSFLDSLEWVDHPVGGNYILRTGKIYGKWIAATQLTLNGKLMMTEYTPGAEYITVVDPRTGAPAEKPMAVDANDDKILEIAFLHEKLKDSKYHMYTIYQLQDSGPQLIWKSGGEMGDWLRGNHKPAPVQWGNTDSH